MNELYILWTNDNLITSEKMVFMYALNAKKRGWWDKITLIIWGSTAKLSAENEMVRTKLKEMMEEGVRVSACKACAEQLGVSENLEELGVELMYWGEGLTEIIQSGKKLITI
ncbi:DsrE family protein [Oceanispirochaeta sp.]|jgi:hypothetical protein|uniref:DsrE family protein n=1 Tax=Oceanispirochaeta sp. TaxID=2035350 RepID=UPI002605E9AC|nr:DsrE family protein [Oceanispirochaeta sp.]MDA3957487.1 DsrE family protein [Oceanispirochaeta sp.]